MDNAEEIFQALDDFSKRKPKIIPRELEDYLAYVARTGDPVYQWALVKCLFKEKMLNVITDFYENSQSLDIPHCPNVDPFNYDTMKNSLIERIEAFSSAPFTVQRICELLTSPNKQYNRIDKFMRAIEKNVLVVSTREPGVQRHTEHENGESIVPMLNGTDSNSDYNVDVEMEDMSWKENHDTQERVQPQPSSSEARPLINDVEARWIQNKPETSSPEKCPTQFESVTPPDLSISRKEVLQAKADEINGNTADSPMVEKTENVEKPLKASTSEQDVELNEKTDSPITEIVVIPEITIEAVETSELKPDEGGVSTDSVSNLSKPDETEITESMDQSDDADNKIIEEEPPNQPTELIVDEQTTENSNPESEFTSKDVPEVLTSSEESSSSSDNTDGNSNSPKTDIEIHIDPPSELTDSSNSSESKQCEEAIPDDINEMSNNSNIIDEDINKNAQVKIQEENIIPEQNTELAEPVKEPVQSPTEVPKEAEIPPEPIKESAEEVTKEPQEA